LLHGAADRRMIKIISTGAIRC